jgi:tripartite-type tricarboxylate transporter receptor subunit TctC
MERYFMATDGMSRGPEGGVAAPRHGRRERGFFSITSASLRVSRARNRAGALVVCTALLAILGFAAPTVSASVTSAKTPLEQGMSFYKGQTLTLVAPTATGSQFDTEVRVIAPLMGTYLHATVNVEDAGSSVAGANTLVADNPNGLTFGFVSPTGSFTDQVFDVPGYNFNPERLPFLGGPVGTPQMIVGYKGSPYSDFQKLLTATAADPIKWLGNITPGGDLPDVLFAKAFGLHVQFING